jgi:chitodextrinase
MNRIPFVKRAAVLLGLVLAACEGSSPDAPGHLLPLSDLNSAASADLTPPSAPSNLMWANDGLTVALTWSPSTDDVGVVGYDLLYGSFFLGTFSDTTLVLIGFKPGTPYVFTVKARDAAGNLSLASNATTVLLAALKDTTPPTAPTNLRSTSVTATSISLAWNPSSDDVGIVVYQVYSGSTVVGTAPAGTTGTVSGLSPGTTYGFTVVAKDAAGNTSASSSVVSVTTTSASQSISVNVGGAATGTFLADADFSGGTTYSNTNTIDTSLVSSSVPAAVFQSERYGPFTYSIPGLTAGSPYVVTLYFAETYLSAAGARLFDVAINGAKVLSGFDIYAAAGAQNKAVAQSFNATADGSGQVTIAFTAGAVENPKACGIAVASGSLPTYSLNVSKSGAGAGTVSGGGINCGGTCTASVVSGTSVTLTASPSSGSSFSGWSGACSGTSPTCAVTMSAAQTVTATFGTAPTSTGPCDLYAADSAPCVAAHSTVRALYGAYTGSLYQVRRASDGATKDVLPLTAGGYANSAVQDSFCASTTCTISVIYDQSPNGNHLTKTAPGGWLNNGGTEADAAAAKIKVGGHTVYGIYVTMSWDNNVRTVAYRNNKTKGVATGDQAESMYMVVDGQRSNEWCCFDYGNAETDSLDDGDATMEALYFGTSTQWSKGNGAGPWVLADLENGLFAGADPTAVTASNTPIAAKYTTAMLKGPSGNRFALKAGDAQSGSLAVKYDGQRPAGYSPMKKQGAIILGTGGDNSHTGIGTFFEGCMTSGNPSDATDSAVQANIVAAGYGN